MDNPVQKLKAKMQDKKIPSRPLNNSIPKQKAAPRVPQVSFPKFPNSLPARPRQTMPQPDPVQKLKTKLKGKTMGDGFNRGIPLPGPFKKEILNKKLKEHNEKLKGVTDRRLA